MHSLDYAVILLYLAILAAIGLALAKRAGRSTEHYFLGGRGMPWWALGASGMASNLDIAGTMTIVAMIYQYGLHGLFIEFRGGVVLPIAVFLAFMGKWHRRSGVMTTAEWMLLRFGDGPQGRAARATAAFTYLVITVAMVVFFFSAGGRFLSELLPFSPLACTLGMACLAFGYTLIGGLYGVVWTDVFQAGIIGGAAVYLAVVGASQVSPELLAAWPGAQFNTFLPHLSGDAGLAPYEAFGWFFAVWGLKGMLEGLGGSGGTAYMAQRFYAARTDAECQKIGMLWSVLFAFRWPMVLGFAILAMKLGSEPGSGADAERILPLVLKSDFVPVGIRGLVIAALLAAAMSTFDSTVNAGASYVVKDLYEPFRPTAGERELVWVGYAASAAIVGIALGISLVSSASLLGIWVGIVMLLFPAFLVPFALRWFWARFNGAGFTGGILCGFSAATWLFLSPPADWNEAEQFLLVAGVSLTGSVAIALLTAPVARETLRMFYDRIGPFGFWPAAWRQARRTEHRDDLRRLGVATVWHVLTMLIPMGLVLGMTGPCLAASVVWLVLFAFLLRDLRRQPASGA